MKKIVLAAAIATFVSGSAFAQTKAAGDDANKAGMTNSSTEMNKGASGMNKGGTTGMSKDGMSNNMNRGAESKNGDGMAKGGMKK